MPSQSQDIKLDMDSDNGGDAKKESDGGRDGGEPGERAPAELDADRRGAFALRDFLGPPHAVRVLPDATQRRDSLPYIDEPTAEEDSAQSEDERPLYRDVDTEDVLSSAACRLRRWRAASRKLRRPRAIGSGGAGGGGGSPLLVERLRGLTAAEDPASLAPPPAATAPPSPGCLLTPTLADQSTAEYFAFKLPNVSAEARAASVVEYLCIQGAS
ncbi:hypothetical protein EVAR_55894_1 [Eumeta japonica]|uniref:Uncharacterized protein n=1 Tax=Eumeta variegata TaxID=151549 RepID=A0A4C1YKT3_EUMVA|nr:hypothetical protein EVAR_55894_1 [Eumeta japonica]